MRRRILVLGALLCAVFSAFPRTGLAQGTTADPHDFAIGLAQNHAPAGVVVPEKAWQRVSGASYRSPREKRLLPGEDVAAYVARFNASSHAFRATTEKGVVHVRSAGEPIGVHDTLARLVYIDESVELSAFRAVFEKVVVVMQGEERGLVGSGIDPAAECPIFRPVRVSEGETTIAGQLDSIVRQVPGLIWFVTYDPDVPNLDLRVGLMCADGTSTTITASP